MFRQSAQIFIILCTLLAFSNAHADGQDYEIRWPAVKGAVKYLVDVADNDKFENSKQFIVQEPKFKFEEITSSSYFVRIAAIDAVDKQYGFSSASVVKFESEPAELIEPEKNQQYFLSQKRQIVSFSWDIRNDISKALFQIATDPKFSDMVYEEKLMDEEVDIELEEGKYYWRVVSILPNMPVRYVSDTRVFEIVAPAEIDKLILEKPKSRELIRWNDMKEHAVVFQVKPDARVKVYDFSIFNDIEMKKIKYRKRTNTPKIEVKLAPGEYFWTATAIDVLGRASPKTSAQPLSIRGKIKAARMNPLPKKIVTRDSKAKTTLKWEGDVDAEEFEVQVSRTKKFDASPKTIKATDEDAVLELAPGIYYIRVGSRAAMAWNKAWSRTQAVRVVLEKPLRYRKTAILSFQSQLSNEESGNGSVSVAIPNNIPYGLAFNGNFRLSNEFSLGAAFQYAKSNRPAANLNAVNPKQQDVPYKAIVARVDAKWDFYPQTRYNDLALTLGLSYFYESRTLLTAIEGTEVADADGGFSDPALEGQSYISHAPGLYLGMDYALGKKFALFANATVNSNLSFKFAEALSSEVRTGVYFAFNEFLMAQLYGGFNYRKVQFVKASSVIMHKETDYLFGLGVGWYTNN